MNIPQTANRDWISLSLAPFKQSLRIYTEVQRSALETFSRLGALATHPLLSAFGGSTDIARSAPVRGSNERAAVAKPATAKRAAPPKPPAAKRPTAARPAVRKATAPKPAAKPGSAKKAVKQTTAARPATAKKAVKQATAARKAVKKA
ncbi:MAG: hypothetical protein ACRD0O_20035 [Acidimicrobiia bacterium]